MLTMVPGRFTVRNHPGVIVQCRLLRKRLRHHCASADLWWWRRPRWTWRNVNLTAIWYRVPAAKLIYLALLANSNVKFYGAQLISEARGLERTALESISTYLDVVANAHFQTFARGWDEALATLQHNEWIVPTLAALLFAGVVATCLAKDSKASDFPPRAGKLLGDLLPENSAEERD